MADRVLGALFCVNCVAKLVLCGEINNSKANELGQHSWMSSWYWKILFRVLNYLTKEWKLKLEISKIWVSKDKAKKSIGLLKFENNRIKIKK